MEHLSGHGTSDRIRNTCQGTKHLSRYGTPVRTRNTCQDTEHLTRYGTPVRTRNTCHDTEHLSRHETPVRIPDLQAEIGGWNLPSPQPRRYPINHHVLFPLQCSLLARRHEAKFRKKYSQAAKQGLKTNMDSTYLTD
jgi:hypothetical protein